jgi:hypothetical protein
MQEFSGVPEMYWVLNAHIDVKCAGQEKPGMTIPVSAIVVPKFELVPGSLLLPRVSSTGPIYEGKCLCRSWTGKELRLKPFLVPRGIVVTIEKSIANNEQALVTVKAGNNDVPNKGTDSVVLFASDGETGAVLTLPVSFWKP